MENKNLSKEQKQDIHDDCICVVIHEPIHDILPGNKEIIIDRKNNIDMKTIKKITESLGFFFLSEEEYSQKIYTDQDNNEHIIYGINGRMIPRDMLKEIYLNTFMTGNICRDRGQRYFKRIKSLGFVDDKVSFLTVSSLIAALTFSTDSTLRDMTMTMSILTAWIDGIII
jgi:hypothetical protein